jgi:hypothetical protein
MNIKPGEFVECSYAELQAIHKKTLRDHERLIAAAPDLLEALLECLQHLERDDQHIDALGWKMPHYTKACAAIAKATGSKP